MNDYYELMSSHPELFVNTNENNSIKVLTSPAEIEKFESQNGQRAGIVYEDEYISLLKDVVEFPDHSVGTYIRILSKPENSGVVILPVKDSKILLINHYRHAVRRFSLELPRGFSDARLSVVENAKRELFEECGITANSAEVLGKINADTGLLANDAWVVKMSFSKEGVGIDEKESINGSVLIPIEEVVDMIATNKITDSYTISAIFLAMSQKAF